MERMTKEEQQSLMDEMLELLRKSGGWMHPDWLSGLRYPKGCSQQMKTYYLNKLIKQGLVEKQLKRRGWYYWYQYRAANEANS